MGLSTRARANGVSPPPLNGMREIAGHQASRLDQLIRRLLRTVSNRNEAIMGDDALQLGARLANITLPPALGARFGAKPLQTDRRRRGRDLRCADGAMLGD